MRPMIANAEVLADHLGDPEQCPEIGAVPRRIRDWLRAQPPGPRAPVRLPPAMHRTHRGGELARHRRQRVPALTCAIARRRRRSSCLGVPAGLMPHTLSPGRDEDHCELADRERPLFGFHPHHTAMSWALARRQLILARCPSRFGRGPTRLRLDPRRARLARTSSAVFFAESMDSPREPHSGPGRPPPLVARPQWRTAPRSPASRCRTP
jgi:hypothetical protein